MMWILTFLSLLKKIPKQIYWALGFLALMAAVYTYGYLKGRASIPSLELPPETISPGTAFVDTSKFTKEIGRLKLLLARKPLMISLPVEDSNCAIYVEQLQTDFENYKDSLQPVFGLAEMALTYPDSLKDTYEEIPGYDLKVTVYPKRTFDRFRWNAVPTSKPEDRKYKLEIQTFLALSIGAGYDFTKNEPALKGEFEFQDWELTFTKSNLRNWNRDWAAFIGKKIFKL